MFYIVQGLEHLGIGKLIEVEGNNGHIEYFHSPGVTEIRVVNLNDMIRRELSRNTRIFVYHAGTGYWGGRVRHEVPNGVLVRITGIPDDREYPYQDLFLRWNHPIDNPVLYLAQSITETPRYAQARTQFLKSYIDQRNVTKGVSSLLSSLIDLEGHQVTVVSKVLNDPSQRYLLADEVGLGKTIEAGVIIRQAVLDDPKKHRIIVLVPKTLVHQWRKELKCRFALGEFLDISVSVVSHNAQLNDIAPALQQCTMLVIDEAHHITGEKSLGLYECVKNYTANIDRLLLLSATPVLRNETGFLRMLHLLDPVMHPLDNIDLFRTKIRHRQALAETVAALDPQNALFLNQILNDLIAKLPEDTQLATLINQLRPLLMGIPDENDPALIESIRHVRAHISETYRLHRRILRNRRKRVHGITPGRAGAIPVEIIENQLEQIEQNIHEWRIQATGAGHDGANNDLVCFHWNLVTALLTQPGQLQTLCNERLILIQQNEIPEAFPEEVDILQEIVQAFNFDIWIEARFNQLIITLEKYLVGTRKIVIFCSDPDLCNAIHDRLNGEYPPQSVVRHTGLSEDFINNDNVRIIVCDHTAEEGLNLQGGNKWVIHFDLPLEPNRIEQRIGRVDRYGAGDAVKSIVLMDGGSQYQKLSYEISAAALSVFDRSISSLQYLIESEMQSLHQAIFEEGIDSLTALSARWAGVNGLVAQELKLIDQQDALDELMPQPEVDFEPISDIDSNWQGIRQDATNWAINTLMFEEWNMPNPNAVPGDQPFRFRYRVPGQGGQATLIPLRGFLDEFLGVLDYEHGNAGQILSYPHCARRQTAVRHAYRLIRYGDEFVDALKSFSDRDDRGRSYALWRYIQGYANPKRLFFSFAFLVETDLLNAQARLEGFQLNTDAGRAAIRRRGDALFTPFVEYIWLDEDGLEPTSDFINTYLNRPYNKENPNLGYLDRNLNSKRLRQLMNIVPDRFVNWDLLCERLRVTATEKLLARDSLANRKMEAIDRAKQEDAVRYAQLTTRIQYLQEHESVHESIREKNQLEAEQAINACLYSGILNPSVKVDVAGVVLLSQVACPLN